MKVSNYLSGRPFVNPGFASKAFGPPCLENLHHGILPEASGHGPLLPMRAVIQRVQKASVDVSGREISSIGPGLLTLLGIAKGDSEAQLEKLLEKISQLRIFEDEQGKMNRSLKDVGGSHLIVSQFTLLGDCSKGTRPGFSNAESPERAKELYEKALQISERLGLKTCGGEFRAHMQVHLVNDGPVTFVLDF